MNDDDDLDPAGELDQDDLERQRRLLQERYEAGMEDELRRLGVYVGEIQFQLLPTATGMCTAMVVSSSLGRVAFMDRTQDPEKNTIDTEFAEMMIATERDAFLDERARMLREGPTPQGDTEDE